MAVDCLPVGQEPALQIALQVIMFGKIHLYCLPGVTRGVAEAAQPDVAELDTVWNFMIGVQQMQ